MKFGIEIEAFSYTTSRREIARLITEEGVDCYEEGYNHSTRSHWKIVYDISVTGGGSNSIEVVSPILYGEDGLQQVKTVLSVLEQYAKVDRTCGIHVHHDASEHTVQNIRTLGKMYLNYESNIDSILPKSRRENNNRFCHSMIGGYGSGERNYDEMWEMYSNAKSIHNIVENQNTRYQKLNFKAYVVHGTIEFRQHSGSLDFEKVSNWVLLTGSFMERCKQGRMTKRGKGNFESLLYNTPKSVKKFYRARKAHFEAMEA